MSTNKIKNYENGKIYGLETLINGPEYRYIENILLIYKNNEIYIYFKDIEKNLFFKILKNIIWQCFFIQEFEYIKIKKIKEKIIDDKIKKIEINIKNNEKEIIFNIENIIKNKKDEIIIDYEKNIEFIEKKIENILINDLNIIKITIDEKTFKFLNTILMIYAENEEEETMKIEIQLKNWDI